MVRVHQAGSQKVSADSFAPLPEADAIRLSPGQWLLIVGQQVLRLLAAQHCMSHQLRQSAVTLPQTEEHRAGGYDAGDLSGSHLPYYTDDTGSHRVVGEATNQYSRSSE